MSIETLDDIVEELANGVGVYGAEQRSNWVANISARIRHAVETESKLRAAEQQPAATAEANYLQVVHPQEFLGNRGLADLSLYWPTNKPIPQIDYESGEAQPTLLQLLAAYGAECSHVLAGMYREQVRLKEEYETLFRAAEQRPESAEARADKWKLNYESENEDKKRTEQQLTNQTIREILEWMRTAALSANGDIYYSHLQSKLKSMLGTEEKK